MKNCREKIEELDEDELTEEQALRIYKASLQLSGFFNVV